MVNNKNKRVNELYADVTDEDENENDCPNELVEWGIVGILAIVFIIICGVSIWLLWAWWKARWRFPSDCY